MPPPVPFLSPNLSPPGRSPLVAPVPALLLLTLFPIAENVYDAPLGFRPRNPVDVPTRTCILDKTLHLRILRRMWSDRIYICISGYGNKMDKISITKMAYVIYVASCFWSRVKQRGHPLSEYLFKVSAPSYRHFSEACSVERFQRRKKYSFPKRRRVYGR